MARLRLATVWLGGCSGCHMSFLDLDEWLIEFVQLADIVFTPLMDRKVFPENVDVVLVEGAVANEDNFHFIQEVRDRSRLLVSLGDCAVTGNVTAYRNPLGSALPVLQRSYVELPDLDAHIPVEPGIVPRLLEHVLPVHAVVRVDAYLPGCPPPPNRIRLVLETLIAGKSLELHGKDIKFG